MTLPTIILDADTTHFIVAAFLSFVGYELRAWRIFYQNKHGGAPDSISSIPSASGKTS